MEKDSFLEKFHDRTREYAGYALEPSVSIFIDADPYYASSHGGIFALETLVGLCVRLGASIVLSPNLTKLEHIRCSNKSVGEVLESQIMLVNPFSPLSIRHGSHSDISLFVGKNSKSTPDLFLMGNGWNGYCGVDQPRFEVSESDNIFGGAISAILAAAKLFYKTIDGQNNLLNAYDWSLGERNEPPPSFSSLKNPPHLWFIGLGSVGASAAYFLANQSNNFKVTLTDGDKVEIENITRSPIFDMDQTGLNKACVVGRWLEDKNVAIQSIQDRYLTPGDWINRGIGTPDLLISAANEHNVRSIIEGGSPPIQIYGTTGKNNNCAVIRHIPGVDPCSTCLFPNDTFMKTKCATGKRKMGSKVSDAALPFMSYLSGLMTASEIFKLTSELTTVNRQIITLSPELNSIPAKLYRSEGCSCGSVDHRWKDSIWPALS